ncbi:MAG: MFS transporter [Flavisolibacter sp.]
MEFADPIQINNRERLTAIIGGSIGNLVEWYDWYAYAAFALYFSPAFFPNSNHSAQLLNTAGIFSVGFLMRPIGAWLFGRLADRKGRKKSMALSIMLMSFGSLLISCIPVYNAIGIFSPILLVFARIIQGLSVGGEYGSAATYLSEMAPKGKKAFYSSFQYVSLIGGQLLALGIQLILQKVFLNDAQLLQWGWRIPFVIGSILSSVAFYIRIHLSESKDFEEKKLAIEKRGTIKELLNYPWSIFTVVGLTLGGTIAFYTFSIYMQKFLVNTAHLTISQSTLLSFVTLLIFAFLQPLFGLGSDKIGNTPLLLFYGISGRLCTVPILTCLSHVTSVLQAFVLLVFALFILSAYTSINALVKAELFPPGIRALGVGLPYALTTAVFGGTAEYIALLLKTHNHEQYFYWYVTACIFISLIVYIISIGRAKVFIGLK